MPTAVAARAQARVHVHRGEVSIVVLGIDRAGISSVPGGVFQAVVQLVDGSGAAGGESAVRDHHVFWRVVYPLLLRQTGWRRGSQGAMAVHAAVRVP